MASPPILPCLETSQDASRITFETRNRDSLSEILLGFLNYFSHNFSYEHMAISLRRCRALKKKYSFGFDMNQDTWRIFSIEEPMMRGNVARRLSDPVAFKIFFNLLQESNDKFKREKDLQSIFFTAVNSTYIT